MTHAHPPTRHRDHNARDVARAGDLEHKDSEIGALREENAELRKLVIELSKLVIRNVVERNH
jgi:hypothetical protein